MKEADAVGPADPPLPTSNIPPWKRAHERLVRQYVDVLRGVWRSREILEMTFGLPRLVRWLVGDHIAKRAAELRSFYVRLEAAAAADPPPAADMEWLTTATASWEKIEASIPRHSFAISVSPFLPIVGAVVAGTGSRLTPGALSFLWGALPVLIIYFLSRGFISFRQKRRMFCGATWILDEALSAFPRSKTVRAADRPEIGDPDRNIYLSESELFALIGADKPHEQPLDLYLHVTLMGSAVGWFVSVLDRLFSNRDWWAMAVLGSVLISYVVYAALLMVARYRQRHYGTLR